MDWEFIADQYSTKPPTILYHYTSSDGLKGILEARSIRATEIGYLNDTSEMQHGIEVFKKAAREIKKQDYSVSRNIFNFDDDFVGVINGISSFDNIFTCSFSTKQDSLSQWRSYCPKEGGYSIGFEFLKLAKHGYDSKCRFFKCIYKNSKQIKMAKEILGGLLYFVDSTKKTNDISKSTFSTYIRSAVKFFCAVFKNEAFSDEAEWRFITVYKSIRNKDICFNSKEGMLVPYTSIDLGNVNIPEIWIGPGKSTDMRNKSVTKFVDVHNIDTEIKVSNIPFR